MPEIPVGDVLRSVVKTGWLRRILDLLKGVRITRGGTTIVLSEKDGATPPRTGLDQPHQIEPPDFTGRQR
jgi:hypothetical protein